MNEKNYKIGKNATIREPTIIYPGNQIGDNFTTGHFVSVRENNKIGNNVTLGSHTNLEHHITIEDNVRMHTACLIAEYSIIKHDCWFGPHVVFTNAKYPRSRNVHEELKAPIIEEFVKIGGNATILPGVTVGKHALIGAGALVAKDVPEFAIVIGNPGRVIGDIRDKNVYDIE